MVFAGMAQAICPVVGPRAKGDNGQPDPRDGLPAGVIACLGSPHSQQNNLDAIFATFLPDGRTVVSGSPEKKLTFWDARTGRVIRTLDGHMVVVVSHDGRMLGSKRGGRAETTVRLVDLVTAKEIGQISGGEGGRNFCFSADGQYLAIGGGTHNGRTDDPELCVWEVATKKNCKPFLSGTPSWHWPFHRTVSFW